MYQIKHTYTHIHTYSKPTLHDRRGNGEVLDGRKLLEHHRLQRVEAFAAQDDEALCFCV